MQILHGRVLQPLRRMVWSWLWTRRQRRLTAAGWYDPAARSEARAVLIGGCPRSGTTLVRELLARHPAFANTVETAILVPGFDPARVADRWGLSRRSVEQRARQARTLVELVDGFYSDIAADQGRPRWIDKAPSNVRVIGQLLAWFPRAHFIHVLRDGRDVVCSLRHHPGQVLVRGEVVASRVERAVFECARTWVEEASLGLAYREHPRCLEVRYEQLLAEPRTTLGQLSEHLGEPFDRCMLRPAPGDGPQVPARLICNPNAAAALDPSRIGRWRHELDRAERVLVHHVAGALLEATGYAVDGSWVDQPHAGTTPAS